MFYLIIAILLVLYYVFVAPKTVKNTMNMISLVAIVAFLLVLAGMTFIKILCGTGHDSCRLLCLARCHAVVKKITIRTVCCKSKQFFSSFPSFSSQSFCS